MYKNFYELLTKKGVQFYSSNLPKDIEKRFKSDKSQFCHLNDPSYFDTVCNLAKERNDVFVHMNMEIPKNQESASGVLVVDVDSRLNGTKIMDLVLSPVTRSFQNVSLPFFNKTPHGYHFFYNNSLNRKNRVLNKISSIGILADYFPRGWVTVLGEGYSLFEDDKFSDTRPGITKPELSDVPYFLYPTNSKTILVQGGCLLNHTYEYFRKHFGVTRKVRTTTAEMFKEIGGWQGTFATKIFLETGYLYLRHFDQIPNGLAKLLNEFEFVGPITMPKEPLSPDFPYKDDTCVPKALQENVLSYNLYEKKASPINDQYMTSGPNITIKNKTLDFENALIALRSYQSNSN